MSDGKSVYCRRWMPESSENPVAVVHINHGMAEHSKRYQWFAEELTRKGMVVYAHDHRGHGKTADQSGELGVFDRRIGWDRVVLDIKEVGERIRQEHKELPFILFGHSMGSLLCRDFLGRFDVSLAGAIFSGTAGRFVLRGKIGVIMARLCAVAAGADKPSPLMDKVAFGRYIKPFNPVRTKFDWLSRDPGQVDAYIKDPLCGFLCSAWLFVDVISGIGKINKKDHMAKTPADLPIYLLSGSMDPVGNFSKGVLAVGKAYRHAGVRDVTIRIYDGGRHEMLNETNKNEVARDVIHWIRDHL